MAFRHEGFSGGISDEERSQDLIAQINDENPDESRHFYQDKKFAQEQAKFKQIGEANYSSLTEAARKKMEIRDGQDLGEFLHEKVSWEKQIEGCAESMAEELYREDSIIDEFAKQWNGRDPMTGESMPDSVFEHDDEIGDARIVEFIRGNFRNATADRIGYNPDVINRLIMLATDTDPAPTEDPIKKDAETLHYLGTKKWLDEMRGNEAAMNELEQNSAIYFHVRRMLDARKRVHEGTYHDDDGLNIRATDTWLYKYIDGYMTQQEDSTTEYVE